MSNADTAPGPAAAGARRGRTPSADVRRELVSAAEAVLVRDGPAGLTVRAVAAQAGVAPMSVYNRLGGKDGLVNALLIRGFDGLEAAIAAADHPDVLERLRAAGRQYREFALVSPHFYAIMFEEPVVCQDKSGLDMSAEAEEHAAAAFGALVRIVELAAAAGRIEVTVVAEVAQQIWSAVHGAVSLELKGLIHTPDPAATYEAFLTTIIRGLARHD